MTGEIIQAYIKHWVENNISSNSELLFRDVGAFGEDPRGGWRCPPGRAPARGPEYGP